jgi:DNA-binding CsgD family transcriptional regulator
MSLAVILGYILSLLAGLGLALAATSLARRYQHRFLALYRNYVILMVSYAFLSFVGRIFVEEVLGKTGQTAFLANQIIVAMTAPLFSTLLFMMYYWPFPLLGLKMPAWLMVGFWSAQVLLGVVFFTGFGTYYKSGDQAAFAGLLSVVALIAAGLLLFPPIILLVGSCRVTDRLRRRLALGLGLIHGGIMLLLFLSEMVTFPPVTGLPGFAVNFTFFFLLHLLPLVFLWRFLAANSVVPYPAKTRASNSGNVLHSYGVTKRESEIAALLIRGLRNDEIAEKLFISAQTVKNHVSSIYKKTGARNRVELVNMSTANPYL